MPFNPTTENLWQEVQEAINVADKHVKTYHAIIRRMTGRWYLDESSGMSPEPENFCYSYVSNVLPLLASDNPEVKVKAARVIGHKVVSDAMMDGINAWVGDVDYSTVIEPVLIDFLATRGVLVHYLDAEDRFSRGLVTPKAKRISPTRFFQDALADSSDTDEFRGHTYMQDIQELVDDPELLPEARERLTGMAGHEKGQSDEKDTAFSRADGSELGRRRVRCHSVWIRSLNQIRVLVDSSTPFELYPPRQYFGPVTGPYVLFDAYPVSDSTWPLSPIVAVMDQTQDLNSHAAAMSRAAARMKTLGLVEASNPDLARKITNARDGSIVPVKGITGQHVMIEIPGPTREQYQYTEYVRDRLERISGLTATTQGAVGKADTATEAKIADDRLSTRIGYLRRKTLKRVQESLWTVGWYLFHTEGVAIPVSRRDPYTGMETEGMFFGGPSPLDNGASWDDFGVEIRVNTLQAELDARNVILQLYNVFRQIAMDAPAMPWVRSMAVMRDIADAFGMPDKADEWFIPELLGGVHQPPMAPASAFIGPRQIGQQPRPNQIQAQPQAFGPPSQQTGNTGSFGAGGAPSGPRPSSTPSMMAG